MKGIVIRSTGSWYTVLAEDGRKLDCRIKGVFRIKGIKTTNPIAVGDHVIFSEEEKDTPVITEIEKRKNYIIRRSTNLSKQSHILAANIDLAWLVVTLAAPRTSTGFIDRFLLTAEAYHIPAVILFNKADQYDEKQQKKHAELKQLYKNIGYETYLISALDKNDVAFLSEKMHDKVNLVAGHSGVGKSTLINALIPNLNLKTANISAAHNKGTHTTTFAEMIILPSGGFIVDTPGIKEFGIVDMEKNEIGHYFPEMRALMHECRFNNCLHLNEPGCAVKDAVENGEISISRYSSYLSIVEGGEL